MPTEEGGEPIASPFKRQRSSMPGLASNIFAPLGSHAGDSFSSAPTSGALEAKQIEEQQRAQSTPEVKLDAAKADSDEEL